MNYALLILVLLALLTAPCPAHAPIKGGAMAVLICDPAPVSAWEAGYTVE
jgi:hypothetical protein